MPDYLPCPVDIARLSVELCAYFRFRNRALRRKTTIYVTYRACDVSPGLGTLDRARNPPPPPAVFAALLLTLTFLPHPRRHPPRTQPIIHFTSAFRPALATLSLGRHNTLAPSTPRCPRSGFAPSLRSAHSIELTRRPPSWSLSCLPLQLHPLRIVYNSPHPSPSPFDPTPTR